MGLLFERRRRTGGKKSIEEVGLGESKKNGKGILKAVGSTGTLAASKTKNREQEIPSWTWTKKSTKVRINIEVPNLVSPHHYLP